MKISRKDLENLSQEELLQITKKLKNLESSQKQFTLERYLETAHAGQIAFHKSKHRIRYFLGSNRSGKTTAGTVEMLWRVLGKHPFAKTSVPIKAAVVGQDFESHLKNILEPKFNEWAPTGAIVKADRNQSQAWRKVYFANGSVMDCYSHDQDVKIFEGSDYDLVWFDEPPPQAIFNAMWRGLTDRGGLAYITGTPLASPWLFNEWKKAEKGDSLRWAITVNIEQNAVNIGGGSKDVGLKRIEEFASTLTEEEKTARLGGQFVQLMGQIFKEWNVEHHLIPAFMWPADWEIWESIDPHPRKPYAVAWIGITPSGNKMLLRSGLFEGTIEDVGEQILHERTQIDIERGLKPRIVRTVIDNAASVPIWNRSNTDPTARRISVREEMENIIGPRAGGPTIMVAPKNVKNKIDQFKRWLQVKGDKSEFYAFDIQENKRFLFEVENYVWDTQRGGLLKGLKDQPRKVDDDILDAIMQVALTLPTYYHENDVKPVSTIGGTKKWRI